MTIAKRIEQTRAYPDPTAARALAALHRSALTARAEAAIEAEIYDRKLHRLLTRRNGCWVPAEYLEAMQGT